MAEEKRYKDQENIPMTEDEINQMIKSGQDRAYNNFEEESWDLARITSEEFKKHMEACDEEDDLHKYLVNGARLTCTQVTYEPFRIPEVGDFYVEEIPDMTKHLYTELNVSENPMGINGQPYATVNDTVKGTNILPFTGNCRVPANDSEKETIMIQLEYGIRRDGTRKQPGVNGVCECLMQLNEQWDNMFFADGKDHCMDRVDIDTEGKMESAKGITRTSVLFCKHGGLIVPVTSGQEKSNNYSLVIDNDNLGIKDSTRQLIKDFEGDPFVKPRINNNGTFTIGYGYDFTEAGDPETFSKFFRREGNSIIVVRNLTQQEIDASIDLEAGKNNITKAVDNFINATGNGNNNKPIIISQNQYDALFSYFYSNGAYVFTEEIYKQEIKKGGENKVRAEARKELRDYLIEENGNYNAEEIKRLFVNSKGWNIKYDYKERREKEAEVFMQ